MGEEASDKASTDPLQTMTTPAVAIYQQPHHKKRKTFHSPTTTEGVERTRKKDLLWAFLLLSS